MGKAYQTHTTHCTQAFPDRTKKLCGPGNSFIITTGYGLDGSGIESRGGGGKGGDEIFRTCPDRSWCPPSLLYNGYGVFLGSRKHPGRDADPSPPSSAEV
jgi:hypothetical protein